MILLQFSLIIKLFHLNFILSCFFIFILKQWWYRILAKRRLENIDFLRFFRVCVARVHMHSLIQLRTHSIYGVLSTVKTVLRSNLYNTVFLSSQHTLSWEKEKVQMFRYIKSQSISISLDVESDSSFFFYLAFECAHIFSFLFKHLHTWNVRINIDNIGQGDEENFFFLCKEIIY